MKKFKGNFLNKIHGKILKGQILKGKREIANLDKMEKTNLLYYALKVKNIELQTQIFATLSQEEKEYYILLFYKSKILFGAVVVEKYYNDFLKICFNGGCDEYLVILVKIGLNDLLQYGAQVKLIQGYFKGEDRDIIDELTPRALGDGAFNNNNLVNNRDSKAEIVTQKKSENESDNDLLEIETRKENAVITFLRGIKRKLDIKSLFLREKYEELVFWINVDNNLLQELSSRELEKLFYYAKDIKNYNENPSLLNFLHRLFAMVSVELQEEAIIYYHDFDLGYGGLEVMGNYFSLFLKVSIEQGFNNYIYKLAQIAVTDKEKYAEAIESIRAYVLQAEPSDDIVKIAGLDGIKETTEPIEEEKQYPNTHQENEFLSVKTADYYNNADSNLKEQVLMSYLNGKPAIEEYIDFIKKTNSFMEAYKALPTIEVIKDEEKSEYLYAMFQINEDKDIRKSLIEDILYLNNYETVLKLMKHLTKEEQNKEADNATKACNYKLMLTLACTTDCSSTFLLITSVIMLNNTDYAVFLVANLNGRYFDYALKMILSKNAEWYLEVLRGLVDMPHHVEAIEFVFNNHFEYLFDAATISTFKSRLTELSTRDGGFGQHYM